MTAAPSTRRLALLLGGLAMFGPFSIDTIFPAFPQIGAQLGADKVAMQQTISAYLLAYAAMSVVHGPLSDAIGRRRVILAGLAVFTLASVGCALSTSLPMLLAFRVLQGLSAGVGLIVGRAVIRDVLHGDDAQRLMSQVSMVFGIAPAIAPVIGGWILGWERWPAIFWFLVAFSLLLLAATWWALPETHPPQARLPLQARPLLRGYWGIFVNRRFQRLTLAGAFNFGALFLYIASAPAFVIDLMKLNERQFGWFFIPMIGGMMLGAFVSGRAAGRISGMRLANLGFACWSPCPRRRGRCCRSASMHSVLPWCSRSSRWRSWTCIRASAAVRPRCRPSPAWSRTRSSLAPCRRCSAIAPCTWRSALPASAWPAGCSGVGRRS
jgi:DHA1 family bicyclomycin/chloramphenicol resistance-like MFS transporter